MLRCPRAPGADPRGAVLSGIDKIRRRSRPSSCEEHDRARDGRGACCSSWTAIAASAPCRWRAGEREACRPRRATATRSPPLWSPPRAVATPSAFETILRHYDRRLRVIADRILNDRQAMDDALQEVAIKALRGLPSFRGDAPLGAWLCRIATTTCLDHLRRLRPEDPTSPDDLPAARACRARPRRTAWTPASGSRPRSSRCRWTSGWRCSSSTSSATTTARPRRHSGVPVGTAASRVAAARARLRAALAAGEEVEPMSEQRDVELGARLDELEVPRARTGLLGRRHGGRRARARQAARGGARVQAGRVRRLRRASSRRFGGGFKWWAAAAVAAAVAIVLLLVGCPAASRSGPVARPATGDRRRGRRLRPERARPLRRGSRARSSRAAVGVYPADARQDEGDRRSWPTRTAACASRAAGRRASFTPRWVRDTLVYDARARTSSNAVGFV